MTANHNSLTAQSAWRTHRLLFSMFIWMLVNQHPVRCKLLLVD